MLVIVVGGVTDRVRTFEVIVLGEAAPVASPCLGSSPILYNGPRVRHSTSQFYTGALNLL